MARPAASPASHAIELEIAALRIATKKKKAPQDFHLAGLFNNKLRFPF
jgi:hypothetical protein